LEEDSLDLSFLYARHDLHLGAQLVLVKKLVLSANLTTKLQRKSPSRSQERGGMLIRQDKLWIELWP